MNNMRQYEPALMVLLLLLLLPLLLLPQLRCTPEELSPSGKEDFPT